MSTLANETKIDREGHKRNYVWDVRDEVGDDTEIRHTNMLAHLIENIDYEQYEDFTGLQETFTDVALTGKLDIWKNKHIDFVEINHWNDSVRFVIYNIEKAWEGNIYWGISNLTRLDDRVEDEDELPEMNVTLPKSVEDDKNVLWDSRDHTIEDENYKQKLIFQKLFDCKNPGWDDEYTYGARYNIGPCKLRFDCGEELKAGTEVFVVVYTYNRSIYLADYNNKRYYLGSLFWGISDITEVKNYDYCSRDDSDYEEDEEQDNSEESDDYEEKTRKNNNKTKNNEDEDEDEDKDKVDEVTEDKPKPTILTKERREKLIKQLYGSSEEEGVLEETDETVNVPNKKSKTNTTREEITDVTDKQFEVNQPPDRESRKVSVSNAEYKKKEDSGIKKRTATKFITLG